MGSRMTHNCRHSGTHTHTHAHTNTYRWGGRETERERVSEADLFNI